jgi:hypothetical protein
MRIAVVFFGLMRSPAVTADNIRRNIYDCNADLGPSLFTLASLNLTSVLNNPRSGELAVEVSTADAVALEADFYALARQEEALIEEPLAAARRRADVFNNDWASIRNLLYQLASLERAWRVCNTVLGASFDYYLFVRPDLLYLDPMRLSSLVACFTERGSIALPSWNCWGGFNDRFAFADALAARHYAERIKLVPQFCAKYDLHPESLLAYALQKGYCKVCELPARAKRVRAQGKVANEVFENSTLRLPQEPRPFTYVPGAEPVFEQGTVVRLADRVPGAGSVAQLEERRGPSDWLSPAAVLTPPLRPTTVGGCSRVSLLRGIHYLELLGQLHATRPVRRYLEIGTQSGLSLQCARGRAVAVDPCFKLDRHAWSARPGFHLFEMSSDEFFARHDPREYLEGAVELAFIDGMHLAEYVLRDFIHAEACCAPDSLIVLHDAIPHNFEMTERDRRPSLRRDKALAGAWTGDVWRTLEVLRRQRPELVLRVLDCPPTGLVLISNLDPNSNTLAARITELTESLQTAEPSESEFWDYIESTPVFDSRTALAPLPRAASS